MDTEREGGGQRGEVKGQGRRNLDAECFEGETLNRNPTCSRRLRLRKTSPLSSHSPLTSDLSLLPSDLSLLTSKSGQSIIEFCIGLVGILTVIAGVFQLGVLGVGRTEARVEAVRRASERSMLPESAGVYLPRFVYQMDAGRDGFTYSVDDQMIGGGAGEAYDRLAAPMVPNQMRRYSPRSEVAQMRDENDMLIAMGLVPGTGRRLGLPVLPVVRRLFFNRQTVDLEVRVWSTRTGDIH